MNYTYIICTILCTMYCTPCTAADTASQQQSSPHTLQHVPTANSHNVRPATAEDIATLLSNYSPEQDPTKPHYLSDAQVDVLNNALTNFFGLKFPGLLEKSQR